MSTTIRKPTFQEATAWARRHRKLALEVIAAKAFAQAERARVDAYIEPFFHSLGLRDPRTGEPIKCSNYIYILHESDMPTCEQFYADCDRLHREHGFTGPAGHCPALIAESDYRDKRRELFDAAHEIMGDLEVWKAEHVAEYERILLSLVMKVTA